MKEFSISQHPLSTVLYLHSDRQSYQLDPDYQRDSDIWPLEKRQLLIDSIINGFDIPKIYFHKFAQPRTIKGKRYSHAIVDGKQRLTSIWGFIDGDFPLGENTEFLHDKSIKIAGLTYKELAKKYPLIKTRFDSYPLLIVVIDTADIDLIEDMFSRLNEAVPLSAAEKRNAFGGPLPPVIRRLAKEEFFTNNVPFANKRYRHYDLLSKFLLIEDKTKVVDTKKIYLDEFTKDWREKSSSEATKLGKKVSAVTASMSDCFIKSDPLLRSVGMLVLYYHLFRMAREDGWIKLISRKKLFDFEKERAANRILAEQDISKAKYDLLEFDRYVQTPNDAYAINVRLIILLKNVFTKELAEKYRI